MRFQDGNRQSERPLGQLVVVARWLLYFFDLFNDMVVTDDQGQELADFEAAKERALREARHMMAASTTEQGKVDLQNYIKVRDEAGTEVHCIDLRTP